MLGNPLFGHIPPPKKKHTHKRTNNRYCIRSGRFMGWVLESNLWIDPWEGSYACAALLRALLQWLLKGNHKETTFWGGLKTKTHPSRTKSRPIKPFKLTCHEKCQRQSRLLQHTSAKRSTCWAVRIYNVSEKSL